MMKNKNKLLNYNLFCCRFQLFALTLKNLSDKKILFCLCFFILFSICCFHTGCQEGNLAETIASFAEDISESGTDGEAVTACIEKLHELNENPVNLNSADETSLSRLFFLTDFQIRSLTDYIRSTGKIFSVYEIASIPGFDRELALLLLPFITIESIGDQSDDSTRMKNTLLANFTTKFNKADDQFGPAHKTLIKYKLMAKGFSAGITSEKDSGEKYLSGNPSQPDFISAYLTWSGTGIIRKIILGDFSGRFGMGTSINTGLRTGLSLTSPGCLSGNDEIKPYTSTDENNFFRGTAVSLLYKKFSLDMFYSLNRIDATLQSSDGKNNDQIGAFYMTGLHNTPSLLSKKDAVTEKSIGINLGLNLRNFRLGALWTSSLLTLPIKPDKSNPVDIYDFEGNSAKTATIYYKSSYGKIIYFGELSVGYHLHTAVVQGLTFRPADRLNLNILYRRYEPGFRSFHGRGPFSSSAGDNTEGIFANFTFEAAKNMFVSAGCDLRHYPWLKYRCSAPSLSVAREIKVRFLPSDNINLETVFSSRSSMVDDPGSDGIKKQINTLSRSIIGLFRYSPYNFITLSTRVACRITEPSESRGMMLMQDICCKFRKIPFSLWMRYCLFNTDDWESRLYVYENDLLYTLSIPAFSGKGSRSYIMADLRFSRYGELRIKYAVSEIDRFNPSEVFSNELKMQLRLWF